MSKTRIEWADRSWNPFTGCSPVSEGCENCYAKRFAGRLGAMKLYDENDPFEPRFWPERLREPIRRGKPADIFVCSMSDLFHVKHCWKNVLRVLDMICSPECSHHRFYILTKRPERWAVIRDWALSVWPDESPFNQTLNGRGRLPDNVFMGVTVENQMRAEERIPLLIEIPAQRFISAEPLLGPINLELMQLPQLQGIICGGETGPGARFMASDWAFHLRDYAAGTRCPFMFKQWGSYAAVGRPKGGRMLEGRFWNQRPGDEL